MDIYEGKCRKILSLREDERPCRETLKSVGNIGREKGEFKVVMSMCRVVCRSM